MTGVSIADVVESTLWSWGADVVGDRFGCSLAKLVDHVLVDPAWLVRFAEACAPEHMAWAAQVAHCVAAGIQLETVDGERWFLPGSTAP